MVPFHKRRNYSRRNLGRLETLTANDERQALIKCLRFVGTVGTLLIGGYVAAVTLYALWGHASREFDKQALIFWPIRQIFG